jgi:uncharacterized membrane protein
MGKGRLEAFSDGVIAIIITIMVLTMQVPKGTDLEALRPVVPVFVSYVLSYVFVGIYWNNHHHLLHAIQHVSGRALWANLHLLFWLSLVPVATGWMGNSNFAVWPVALYGVLLLLCAIAFYILSHILIQDHGQESIIANAYGRDRKGKVSVAIYIASVPLAFVDPWYAIGLFVLVAVIWLVPDRRIEKALRSLDRP